jgi:hypothetical protein
LQAQHDLLEHVLDTEALGRLRSHGSRYYRDSARTVDGAKGEVKELPEQNLSFIWDRHVAARPLDGSYQIAMFRYR